MDENTKKLLLALEYVATYDRHPGCFIDDVEKIKDLLRQEVSANKPMEDILFPKDSNLLSEKELLQKLETFEPVKQDFQSDLPSLEMLLFHETAQLPKVPKVEDATIKSKVIFDSPVVKDPMEDVLAKIYINEMKLYFLYAQNRLLEHYLQEAMDLVDKPPAGAAPKVTTGTTSTPLREFGKRYPMAGGFLGDETIASIFKVFLQKMPCALHEQLFLYSIVKKNESNLR
jgi:hypothetical protein